jgi:hypothetical protein
VNSGASRVVNSSFQKPSHQLRLRGIMKFHPRIAPVVCGLRNALRAGSLAVWILGLSSCVSLIAKKNSYASSPAVAVNGSQVRLQVKPQGTDGGSYAVSAMVVSAAVATLDGPFSWRVEATGEAGKHESLVVHRIRTRTKITQRDEWYPAKHLGKRADFTKPRSATGPQVRAIYPIPGLLKVKPKEDGMLEILVDLTIVRSGQRERKTVKFLMNPAQTRQDEMIFIPTEIVANIGKSPADWEDPGWD